MVIRAEGEAMAAKLISDALRNGQVTNASMNRSMYLFIEACICLRCAARSLPCIRTAKGKCHEENN